MSYHLSLRLPRSHLVAGTSAVAAVVTFGAGNALWALEQPDQDASGPELLEFYGDLSGRIEVGALLSLLSIAIFVVFASALRAVLRKLDRDDLLADVAFGGALIAMATGLGAETINMAAAVRAGDDGLTEANAQALFDVSYVLGYNAAGVGLGLLVLATCTVALRSKALLPRWLAMAGALLGVALLTPLSVHLLGFSFLFGLIVGVLLLRGSAVPSNENPAEAPERRVPSSWRRSSR